MRVTYDAEDDAAYICYESFAAFRSERTAFHDDPGEVGEVLAVLSELAVPGTATQSDFDEHELIAEDV